MNNHSIVKKRTVSFLLDELILFPIFIITAILLIVIFGTPLTPFELYLRAITSFSLPFWIYSVITDSSKNGQSLGKRKMKLRVVKQTGERLTVPHALGRTAIKLIPWELSHLTFFGFMEDWGSFSMLQFISMIILYVLMFTYIVIAVKNKGERGVHDIVVKTKVISISK